LRACVRARGHAVEHMLMLLTHKQYMPWVRGCMHARVRVWAGKHARMRKRTHLGQQHQMATLVQAR